MLVEKSLKHRTCNLHTCAVVTLACTHATAWSRTPCTVGPKTQINLDWAGHKKCRCLWKKHQNFTLLQKIWSHPCYYSLLDMSSCTNSLCFEYICLECLIEVRTSWLVENHVPYFLNDGRHNTVSSVTQYLSTELHVTVTRYTRDGGRLGRYDRGNYCVFSDTLRIMLISHILPRIYFS